MDTRDQISNLEDRLIEAMKTSNVQELDKLISNELIFINQNGQLLTKEADLEAHRSGELEIYDLNISEQQINVYGDVAVVSVVKDLSGSLAGHAFVGIYRYTRVWKQHGQSWKVIAVHASQIIA